MIHMESRGAVEIYDRMDLFTANMRDKAMKQAMKKAIDPIKEKAAANIRKDRTGALRGAVDTKITSKGTKGWEIRGLVGIRSKVRVPVRVVGKGQHAGKLFVAIPTRYAHLVEFGHTLVINGKVVGHIAPQAFMRRAWESHGGDKALAVFSVALSESIDNMTL